MNFLRLDQLLRQALDEDLGCGDVTTDAILRVNRSGPPRSVPARGSVIARESLVLAGWPVFVRVFELLGSVHARLSSREGERVNQGETIGTVEGDASVLLKGERVALNLLQRLSGIAGMTRSYAEKVRHTRARILDTRKTTPLWRSLEKYAVRVGGGWNHRMGLDDGVLIKDNHIALAGGVEQAVEICRREASHLHKIEVEVTDLEQLEKAIVAGADLILLDNMPAGRVVEAVRVTAGRCPLEVSGGVTLETVLEYAETGVDYISVGALTHSIVSADISLEIARFEP